MIEIIHYKEEYHEDFRRLNLEWLDKYNLTESHDLEILDDPQGMVLNTGGIIYLAKAGEEIIGCGGLMKEADGIYEVVKMAVTDAWKGKGIGKLLMEKCLETARAWNATTVSLYTNHQLTTALKIYEQYGFKYVSAENSPFETADIRMELSL